jgi:hypothetical protein
MSGLQRGVTNPFVGYDFRRILADRDIVPETTSGPLKIDPNGSGLTNVFERYVHADTLDRDVVERTLLNDLNDIFRPDAEYSRILPQQRGSGPWEIHLEESGKVRVPMSEMGSGLKTVLLVLANILIVPTLNGTKRPLANFIFGFEELENNLHPAIQRRLFRYLRAKAVKEYCRFFITTHSSVVIDLFSTDGAAQILHVKHDGASSAVMTVNSSDVGRHILDDLDVRASDLLQTNVVVWVEGPSDRIYFNKWIDLYSNGQLCEGVHYQCLPFGGSSNAHLSFNNAELVEDMICALKINRNALLLIDSDKAADDTPSKIHTARLLKEVGEIGGYAWVTEGKEVENYIPVATFRTMFNNDSLTGPSAVSNVLDYHAKHSGNKTRVEKVELARRIIPLLTRESLAETLDLDLRMTAVCNRIRQWNRLDGTP